VTTRRRRVRRRRLNAELKRRIKASNKAKKAKQRAES
jgi:hypothetical protein